jgi:hypothetical protein
VEFDDGLETGGERFRKGEEVASKCGCALHLTPQTVGESVKIRKTEIGQQLLKSAAFRTQKLFTDCMVGTDKIYMLISKPINLDAPAFFNK